MAIECSAIVAVIGVMAMFMFKAGQQGHAVAILPILIVPLSYLSSGWFSDIAVSLLGADKGLSAWGWNLVGLVVACLLMGIISVNIKRMRSRVAYLVCCAGFSVILFAVLLADAM